MIVRAARAYLLLAAAIVLAAGAGLLAATALGVGSQQEPPRTVTVDVATGPTGPTGPAGPTGPSGAGAPGELNCLAGYSEARVVFVQQGKGPTAIYACLAD